VAAKLVIGFLSGSVSVLSEAVHSGVDLLAAAIALFAVRTSAKPADDDHPFGHGKFENVSGTVEAILIFAAAAWIVFEAVRKLVHHEPLGHVGLGVAVMAVSALVNTIVSQLLFKVGRETDSVALLGDGWHLRTDVYTSVGVAVGLAVIVVLRLVAPAVSVDWLDPVVAIGVALLICKAAWDLTSLSGRDLLDRSLPANEENLVREAIAASGDNVLGFHHLRTRKAGAHRFVDFHLLVPAWMSVEHSHHITDEIGDAIRERLPRTSVTIHVEPPPGMGD
jgi:cation diffusion facilitator family transporter